MARHFRTPDSAPAPVPQPAAGDPGPTGADEAPSTSLSDDLFSLDASEPAAEPEPAAAAGLESAPAGEPESAAAGEPEPALEPEPAAEPRPAQAHQRNVADALSNIPSPSDPASPQSIPSSLFMTAEGPATLPATDDDERRQLADLDAALQSPNFTTVFAPVDVPTASQARESGIEPVILMEHLTKVYPAQPNKPALDDVNLAIYPGEFVFLVGHSGSGKSTMLNTIIRDVKPTSGRILVAGQDLTKIKNRKVPYLRRQIGTVFQDYKLLPNKTVYENVAFALQCIGKPRAVIKAQVPEVLRLVGLGERMESFPDELSGGEQQRVSVARAMVNRPPLLVCDEPTGNLDPAISLGIMKLLDRINRTGTTVVVATHDREMVDSMHRRVIALEGGRVIRDQERGGYGNYGSY